MSEATPPINQPDFSELFNLNDLNPAALIEEAASDAKAPLSLAEVANVTHLVRELQQHNAQLVRHVKELEAALEKSQANLEHQLTQGHDQEVLMIQQLQEMVTAQGHITRLMSELESSHHTAQRQQALIETLTEQLQHSQEQVALLERECALKHQQCQDQTQMLTQQEELCSELRSQLQQQRQQTAQFKAALEKCLEKSAATAVAAEETTSKGVEISPVPSESEPEQSAELPLAQPWFVGAETDAPAPADEKVAGLLQELPLSMMESYLIKSVPAESEERYLVSQSLDANLDLTQDLENADADFWQSLEKLIDTPTALMPTPAFTEAVESQPEPVVQLHAVADVQPVGAGPGRLGRLLEHRNPKPFKDAEPANLVGSPSPVVYPQRSTKKLPSLAAVDLPNFPKLTVRR